MRRKKEGKDILFFEIKSVAIEDRVCQGERDLETRHCSPIYELRLDYLARCFQMHLARFCSGPLIVGGEFGRDTGDLLKKKVKTSSTCLNLSPSFIGEKEEK